MPKPTYTISQVLSVPEGDWVNAEIFCNVTNVKPSRGKGPASAMLSDQTGSIVGKFWGGGIEHWEGKRIKIAGSGLQRKAYNGTPELSVSQKADISFAGQPGTAADTHPDLEAAPQPQKPPQNRSVAQAHTQHSQAQGNAVNGQTVGMAVKAAVDIHLKIRGTGAWGEDDAVTVEAIARDIVAISDRVQNGNTHAPAPIRYAPKPYVPASKEELDEDVPF